VFTFVVKCGRCTDDTAVDLGKNNKYFALFWGVSDFILMMTLENNEIILMFKSTKTLVI